jgi:hypothetical protein
LVKSFFVDCKHICKGSASDIFEYKNPPQSLNTRLRKAVSDMILDKLILQETAKGNF